MADLDIKRAREIGRRMGELFADGDDTSNELRTRESLTASATNTVRVDIERALRDDDRETWEQLDMSERERLVNEALDEARDAWTQTPPVMEYWTDEGAEEIARGLDENASDLDIKVEVKLALDSSDEVTGYDQSHVDIIAAAVRKQLMRPATREEILGLSGDFVFADVEQARAALERERAEHVAMDILLGADAAWIWYEFDARDAEVLANAIQEDAQAFLEKHQ